MWHGSHTYVGYAFDNRLMAVLAYLAHQGSVQNLPNKSSILQEISETPRNGTGISVAHDLVQMLADSEPPAWAQFVDTMDIERDYYITFGCFFATVFSLIMPFQAGVKWVMTTLADAALKPD